MVNELTALLISIQQLNHLLPTATNTIEVGEKSTTRETNGVFKVIMEYD